jgi:hypothetical protein
MAKGVALEFKRRFPNMFDGCLQRCGRAEANLGQPYFYQTAGEQNVINFPVKDHWRSMSRLTDIEAGLDRMAQHATPIGVFGALRRHHWAAVTADCNGRRWDR